MLAAAPAGASALAGPSPAVRSNIGAVADFIQRGGATSTVPPVGNAGVVDDLWLSEHRPMPNQTSSAALHRELLQLRTRVGVLPRLASAAGTVTLGATAFSVGWAIGTGIRKKYIEFDAPVQPATQPGPQIAPGSWTLTPRGKGDNLDTANPAQRTFPWETGFQLRFKLSGSSTYEGLFWDKDGCSAMGYPWQAMAPAGLSVIATGAGTANNCPQAGQVATGVYLGQRATPKSGPRVYDGQAAALSTPAVPADVNDDLAEQRTLTELDTYPQDYPTLLPWLDSELGGPSADPTGAEVEIPRPREGEVYADYASRLQEAGLSAVRADVASPEPGVEPNVVLSTSPAGGTRVATGTEVTVRTQPATAPGAGGGDPGLHAIDLGPLRVAQACAQFPFGVPCWLLDTVQEWVVEGSDPPSWTIPFPYTAEGFTLDLELLEGIAPMIRGLLLVLATVGLATRFYSWATGRPGGGDDD